MCKVFFDQATADSFSAYVYSPPVKKVKVCDSHFIDCANPATPTFVQKIKANQEALVDSLIPEQNCGFVNYEGEKLYFYGSQLHGCHLSELSVGDRMNFDIVFNPRTNKFLAKGVRRVAEVKKNVGHFQMMQVSQTANEPVCRQEVATGKVSEICGHTHGFIENEVFFHYSSLVGTHISELSVGTSLSFTTTMNGTQKVAKNVQIATVPELNKNLGHFQMMQTSTQNEAPSCTETSTGKVTEICGHTHGFIENSIFFHYSSLVSTHISELTVGATLTFETTMNGSQKVAKNVRLEATPEVKINVIPEIAAIKTILEMEGAKMLRRLSKNLVLNEASCDKEVESIMQSIKVGSFASRKNSLTPFSDANSRINSRRGSAIGFR